MASSFTPCLAESLATLHDACIGISQWKSVRDACNSGFQSLHIHRTKENIVLLADLRDSLKDLAECFLTIRRGDIPNKRIPAQKQASELIDALPSVLYDLKDSLERAGLNLAEKAGRVNKLATQLESAIEFKEPPSGPPSQTLVQKNSKVVGFAENMTGNFFMGSSGDQGQRIAVENSVLIGSKTSSSNSHNKRIILRDVPASQYQEILQAHVPVSAIQSLTQALTQIPLECIPPHAQRILQNLELLGQTPEHPAPSFANHPFYSSCQS
jgi:hypothetical protein